MQDSPAHDFFRTIVLLSLISHYIFVLYLTCSEPWLAFTTGISMQHEKNCFVLSNSI